ncbi:tRNA synthetases class I-domain-containing protein [Xylaria acuta]|nr:tRNA synthetases class I-domain-containing protein [Xylaria acuta]
MSIDFAKAEVAVIEEWREINAFERQHETDKKFGLSGKAVVEKFGLANYNHECRSIAMRYREEWRHIIEKLDRVLTLAKTMDSSFMESEWWIFKQLFDKGMAYQGHRVMPYSTGMTTALRNFEANHNHRDVTDPAVVVSFPLVTDPKTHLLAWTTTPWTLPINLALAAHPEFEYVKILDEKSGNHYTLLGKLLATLYKDPKGKEMEGWKYEPLFDYFYEEFKDVAFKVVNATYEDDYSVAVENGIIDETCALPDPTNDLGIYNDKIRHFAGMYIKEADRSIIKNLKEKGRLVVDSQLRQSYPMYTRTDTPLIYRAIPSWFIRMPEIVPQMLKNIEGMHWTPSFVKENRFGNWIANARDWNVDDLSERVCISSVEELKELSRHEGELTDLHRDKVETGKGILRRVEHYPFENKEKFAESLPRDFIAEGWFYTLLVLGTHLFGVSPFSNCVVNGINYPDRGIIMEKYDSDALRLYMINSPVVCVEPLRFKEAGVKEVVQKVLLPLWSSYKFFKGQVALLKKVNDEDYIFDPKIESSNTNVMDRWALASCQSLLQFVNEEMGRLYTGSRPKGEYGLDDTIHALNTLFGILFTLRKGLAPFILFITETIYSKLLAHIPNDLQVARMQKVIELARVSRECRTIGLKTPLKSLVVIHSDPAYLADVKSLETYITEELNVRDLVLTSDEAKYNVQYSVAADWPVLGKKLRKDPARVKKALPNVTADEVKEYTKAKFVMVDGIKLEEGDLRLKRELKQDDSQTLEPNTDNDVLTILDAAIYPELEEEGVVREIINRVQRLRKKAGLQPTDDVKMEYKALSDPEDIDKHEITQVQGEIPDEKEEGIIMGEEQEVQKATFLLRLLKL